MQFIVMPMHLKYLAMDGYYTFSFLGLAAGLSFSAYSSQFRFAKYIALATFIFAIVSAILVVSTNVIVEGYKPMGLAMTKIPGGYYSLFSIFALICSIGMLAFFTYGCFSEDINTKLRNQVMLFGMAIFAGSIVYVILGQAIGHQVSASVMIPISLTISDILWVISYASTTKTPLDIGKITPLFFPSQKREFAFRFLTEKMTVRKAKQEVEEAMIKDEIAKNEGHQARTAEVLDISPSGLSKKLMRYRSKDR